jgi:hypothetical protein
MFAIIMLRPSGERRNNMKKEEMINALQEDNSYFFNDNVKECFREIVNRDMEFLYAETSNLDGNLSEMTDLGLSATDVALSCYAAQCPECDGWFLTHELIFNLDIDGKEGLCEACFDDIIDAQTRPDPMTVAHNFKEDNK